MESGEESKKKRLWECLPWESPSQHYRRTQFLQKVLFYQEQSIGYVDWVRLAVLSAAFYNKKYLQCTYDEELEEDLAMFDAPDIAPRASKADLPFQTSRRIAGFRPPERGDYPYGGHARPRQHANPPHHPAQHPSHQHHSSFSKDRQHSHHTSSGKYEDGLQGNLPYENSNYNPSIGYSPQLSQPGQSFRPLKAKFSSGFRPRKI
ncbi:hypothetical protein IE077_004498 [Cardiosporidium cionae]|uniref:Uncharacterized protein n=1 Tax=Cardiosporidium cionae TaxID=476202 RepID=A0ABQ7J8U8_9APIC|nr:hypothetical protein IE077_004498 [Cardiosporidium cionae]|eukprot:KAF8820395.1 hypothetical protein IE077_004498 [Cardiosporidium cionae]